MCVELKCIQNYDFNLSTLSQVKMGIDYQWYVINAQKFQYIRVPNQVKKYGNMSSGKLCWKYSRTWYKKLFDIQIFEAVEFL